MTIDFKDKVAIVTGAGGGLGRSHALELSKRGAKVVVNDLGGSVDGSGGSSDAAEKVVKEIISSGGQAISNGSSVTDDNGVKLMIDQTIDEYGRIDILINNAGILIDKSFSGAKTRYVAPKMVSGRVVNTSTKVFLSITNLIFAPSDFPIQFF